MNWGKAIFLAFLAFGGLIISMVVMSMRQDINLVAEDYYQQEIEYQKRIEQIRNAAEAGEKPVCLVNNGELVLKFHVQGEVNFGDGRVNLFSPLDGEEDVEVILSSGHFPEFSIPVSGLRKGLWLVKIEWIQDGKSCYDEMKVFL